MGVVILHPVTKDPRARRRFMEKQHREAAERQAQFLLAGAAFSATLMMLGLFLLAFVK